jgi:GntR family transcriptional regulator, transcriptional repressor for pyruvate dehydrogenase complex
VSPIVSSRSAGPPSRLDEGAVRELHAVAAILESLAVRLAPPFTAARRAALRAANARLRTAPDPVTAAIADRDVHRALAEACGDDSLLGTLLPVQATLRRLPAIQGAGAQRRHAAEHDAIIDALAAGDNELASRRLRAHVGGHLPEVLRALRGRLEEARP